MQISSANAFYAAAPAMFNATNNPVTVTGQDTNGNIEGVTSNGVKVFADPNGMMAGFSIADVLTPADKAMTGYDPSSGKINELAIALANYRASGVLQGPASPSLVNALKTSIGNTGSYPADPSALVSGARTSSAALASATLNALLFAQESQSAT